MGSSVKCDKCDREFKEEDALEYPNKVRVVQGKPFCEDCLIDMGIVPDEAEPYWTYLKARTDVTRVP
jgi:hypothetical protein